MRLKFDVTRIGRCPAPEPVKGAADEIINIYFSVNSNIGHKRKVLGRLARLC